jgi:hypothetical protein
MCLTCGCSDSVGVRIIDPATGESTTLESSATRGREHTHTDEQGNTFVHTHPVTGDRNGAPESQQESL